MATYEKRQGKNGATRWRARVRCNGYPALSRTFARKHDAATWALEIEASMAAGRFQNSAVEHDCTVGDVITRYIRSEAARPTKKAWRSQAQQLRVWVRLIGHHTLSRLRPQDIAEARDKLAKGRAPATVVRYLASLSHVFTIAIRDWQLIDANPIKQIIKPKVPRGRTRFLSEAELSRLLVACARSPCAPLEDIVTLAVLTGMRRNEILTLCWSNVDLPRRRIFLTDTKNKEQRQVPLTPKALSLIQARTATGQPEGFVFARKPGAPVPDIRNAWREALRAAGIKDFRFHDLRHTAASNLAMSGATTAEIAEILGHKTLSMVQRYAHLTPSHSAKVLDRMERAVFSDGEAHADGGAPESV